jgi:hypothetical protein
MVSFRTSGLLGSLSLLWSNHYSPNAGGGVAGILVSAQESNTTLEIGATVCVEGFVMDYFCIERGTLMDNPSVVTLEP